MSFIEPPLDTRPKQLFNVLYAFDPATRTITFPGLNAAAIAQISVIYNDTTNQVLYNADPASLLGGTISGNVLTYSVTNTGSPAATDVLEFFIPRTQEVFSNAQVDLIEQPAVSLSATGVLFTMDMGVNGMRTATVQVTSAGTATVIYEVSNNRVDWNPVSGYASSDTGSGAGSSTSTTTGSRRFGVSERYFQARVSAYTSGTVTANAVYRAEPVRAYSVNVGNSTLTVLTRPSTSTTADGAGTLNTYISNATNTSTVVSGSAAVIQGGQAYNGASTVRFVKFYNAASITPGTSSALINVPVPPGQTIPLFGNLPGYIRFGTGLCMMITAGMALTDNTSTGAANEVVVNLYR